MNLLKILSANFEAKENSFLYYSAQICYIYGQVLKHIIYHFDPDDLSRIINLPGNYSEDLETLECLAAKYFSC